MKHSGFETERQRALPPLLPPSTSHKKTLVLDLDETLVHSSMNTNGKANLKLYTKKYGKKVPPFNVYFRPNVVNFLIKAGKLFEIVIFTASLKTYADLVIDKLDVEGNVSYRLYREHCVATPRGYVKDLWTLGRKLKDVIIVDNLPISSERNKGNSIPIETWVGKRDDNSLERIFELLKELVDIEDVRKYLRNTWKPGVYDYERVINEIKANKCKTVDVKNMRNNRKLKLVSHQAKYLLPIDKENMSENFKPNFNNHEMDCVIKDIKRISTMGTLNNLANKKNTFIDSLQHYPTELFNEPLINIVTANSSKSSSKYFLKRDLLIRRGRLLMDKDKYIFETFDNPPLTTRELNRCTLPPI